jgi:hypothetical protein
MLAAVLPPHPCFTADQVGRMLHSAVPRGQLQHGLCCEAVWHRVLVVCRCLQPDLDALWLPE